MMRLTISTLALPKLRKILGFSVVRFLELKSFLSPCVTILGSPFLAFETFPGCSRIHATYLVLSKIN